MFKTIFLSLFALHLFAAQPRSENLNGGDSYRNRSIEPFALFTVPISGSHLLIKTLFYMTGFSPHWHTDPPNSSQLFRESHFPYTHCCLSPQLLNYYARSPIKQIVGIRDLRDVAVSILYQIRKGAWPQFTRDLKKREEFKKLSFDEQLLFVIEQEYEIDPPQILLQLGIARVAKQVTQLIRNPSILVCRFVDLIGFQGGGSEEAQKELIRKIGLHIGLYLMPSEIDDLSGKLFGNKENPFGKDDFADYQSTFREGKIGSWKSSFKEIHKAAFKKRLGQALIVLGYEQDDKW